MYEVEQRGEGRRVKEVRMQRIRLTGESIWKSEYEAEKSGEILKFCGLRRVNLIHYFVKMCHILLFWLMKYVIFVVIFIAKDRHEKVHLARI